MYMFILIQVFTSIQVLNVIQYEVDRVMSSHHLSFLIRCQLILENEVPLFAVAIVRASHYNIEIQRVLVYSRRARYALVWFP